HASPLPQPPAALGLSESLLRCVAEQRMRGKSFSSIAAMLNKQGLRGRHGGRWYSASVRDYLLRHVEMRC
ncbi:recombinase family protein, partial [Noviherbaspirillum denitrificans]|uniref:recombinase family protein n=1 Tax=Noviherbaspirillum denitrificans TaxID=1968433 RepID=UPI0019821BBB